MTARDFINGNKKVTHKLCAVIDCKYNLFY